MSAFDVCGPLPTGVTVLEASAGTGKTYTIASLAARYVAEGTRLQDLLLVTFTRMATSELRERVRDRLVAVERGLETGDSEDEVVRLLAAAGDVELRRGRLARALADFDAATIATTHGFCQEVLGGLGIRGEGGRDVTFAEDLTDLLEEVVDDLYVRRFHLEEQPALARREALAIAHAAIDGLNAPIEPRRAHPGSVPAMRRRLAEAVRRELEERKRRMGVMTYDDLLTRLDEALSGIRGPDIAADLQAQYKVVLVDEFQDTDPVQWSIMRRAFGAGLSTLVLIGDPKQAIYAFRGADVYAYLAAKKQAAEVATLQVNWRSDQSLLDAYDALFGDARLGDEDIVYRPMRAAEAHRVPRLTGAGAPLRIRVVDRVQVERTQRGFARNVSAREHIARDLANDLVALLESGARIERRRLNGTSLGSAPVRPGDVAVLVRTHRTAAEIRDTLEEAGIPAVINGAGSVFGTRQAVEWLRLLEALERPADTRRAHAAALTCFFGWSAESVACADDPAWEEVHRRLHEWAQVLRRRGVASLVQTISLAEGLPARVLGATGGERRLTDLRHVGQLLHAAMTSEHLGTTALTGWLRSRIAAAGEETGDEERSRRLESDAAAVQVLTIHRSKGLEFPIVYFPYLWEPGYIPGGVPVAYHDREAGYARTVDVALEGPGFRTHVDWNRDEQRGEDLRLAYVALTRARHQAVLWWAGSADSRDSALGRLVFARGPDGEVPPVGRATPPDAAATARFEEIAATAPGCIAVERAGDGPVARWAGEPASGQALAAGTFVRELDAGWRRTSYSDITAPAHDETRVESEPEEVVVGDEPEGAPVLPAPGGAPPAVALPLAAMPGGVDVGTFVHRVLERTDFAAPDLDAELMRAIASVRARRAVAVGEPAALAAGLRAAIETPLGDAFGALRLRDVARADRLDELVFELPLAGGETPSGGLRPGALGALLREHLAPGDPLHGYAERLEDPELRQGLRGYLTGSLDLVVRAGERFVVVDYKSNRLAGPEEEPSARHFRPAALAAEMERAHYGLQALLYLAALHRYLRWRLPRYEPDRHLGGAAYLFLRGMTGGAGEGVFAFRPRGALVEAVSDLLEAG